MSTAQLRAKLRQAQSRHRQAVNRYNNGVRRLERERQAAIRRLRSLK